VSTTRGRRLEVDEVVHFDNECIDYVSIVTRDEPWRFNIVVLFNEWLGVSLINDAVRAVQENEQSSVASKCSKAV
jgi:hypothetical protein